MISFSNWMLQRESSSHTRARAAAARGLLPVATVGSINGRSTASPFEVKKLKKKSKKKSKKVDETPVKNTDIDSWLKETDKLKDDLVRLKDAFQKHKPEKPKEEKPKPKPEPEEENNEKTGKPESDDEKLEKGKKKGSEEEEDVIE